MRVGVLQAANAQWSMVPHAHAPDKGGWAGVQKHPLLIMVHTEAGPNNTMGGECGGAGVPTMEYMHAEANHEAARATETGLCRSIGLHA